MNCVQVSLVVILVRHLYLIKTSEIVTICPVLHTNSCYSNSSGELPTSLRRMRDLNPR